MQHIISPWLIYFIRLSDCINAISTVLAIMLFISLLIIAIIRLSEGDDVIITKPIKKMAWFFIPFLFLAILIPPKNTLIQMIVADHITYNSINKVIAQGKSIKNEIKKDIIDILTSINSNEKEAKK